MSKQKALKIAQAIITIVVGILIACSIVNESILKYLVGGAIALYGVFMLVKSAYDTKSLVFISGIVGAVLLGIGVSILASYLNFIDFVGKSIMVAIATIGSLFILDSIIQLCLKHQNRGITELVIGCVLLALGLCLILIPDFAHYLWVIFGVLLAIFGVYSLVIELVKLSKKSK